MPLVILGGTDARPVPLPDVARDKHPLAGFKGVDVRIHGRPLVAELEERLLASGVFSTLFLVGPAAVYRGVCASARLIDANGSFGENIRAAVDAVEGRCPGSPIAFTSCDILPEPAALRDVVDDYVRHAPSDLWFPLVRVPRDRSLGVSAWKPAYRIVPEAGEAAIRVLPSHLVVADTRTLRLDFLYRLFQLGYRTRNRPIGHRRVVMVRGVILELLYQDLRSAVRLQSPGLTWSLLWNGLAAARDLRAGTITREHLENAVRSILVRSTFRRRHPDRRVRLPIVDEMSLALDIDTEEEAEAMGGAVRGQPP